MVKQITNAQEFMQFISTTDKITVVDYYADWCGPCKAIAPFFNSLSTKYAGSAQFVKVNVDEQKEIAQAQGISAMPTFQIFKGTKKLGEMRGANPQQLEMLVQQHAQSAAASAPKAVYIPAGYHDITEHVDKTQLECLNQKQDKNIKAMFAGESTLESDVDEQLLISIGFSQAVKVHSLKFFADSMEHAPKTIKIFANRVAMGFDAVDSVEPTQELVLTEADYSESTATALRFVKFQNITSLTLFIEDNLSGDDVTKLKRIQIIGVPVETTNMKDLKKLGHDH